MNQEEYIQLCKDVRSCQRWCWIPVNLLLVPAYIACALAFCAYYGVLNLSERR